MSHFTKISAEIVDISALEEAVKAMGLTIERNARCRYYGGAPVKPLVIKLPGQYDISIEETSEGKYVLNADMWGGHISKYVGDNAELLMQKYAAEKARMEAMIHGLTFTQAQRESDIIVTLTDPETGGQMNVNCHSDGKVDVSTSGFTGQSCMQFRSIEESLGVIEDTKFSAEYYLGEEEKRVERVRNVQQ